MDGLGPDNFRYYAQQIKDLLEDDFMPFSECTEGCSGCLSGDCVGVGLSEYKRARLDSLLLQAVAALTTEIDEMLDPILAMCRLHSVIRSRRECRRMEIDGDEGQNHGDGGLEMSAPLSTTSVPASPTQGSASKTTAPADVDVSQSEEGMSNTVQKHCARCGTANALKWRDDLEGKFLCDACASGRSSKNESHFPLSMCTELTDSEDNDDLRFLLETDDSLVDEILKKYTGELFATLCHMENQLEELLDTTVSICRPMKRHEKLQLQRRIQKLSPQNLNRVVEIVQQNKAAVQDYDEILVDLESQDDVTLKRLYYYVESVEKGKNHSSESL